MDVYAVCWAVGKYTSEPVGLCDRPDICIFPLCRSQPQEVIRQQVAGFYTVYVMEDMHL